MFRRLNFEQQHLAVSRISTDFQQYFDNKVADHWCRGPVGGERRCRFAQSWFEGRAQTHGREVRCLLCDDAKLREACSTFEGRRTVLLTLSRMNLTVQKWALDNRLDPVFAREIREQGTTKYNV
jgi:hypothetical protein